MLIHHNGMGRGNITARRSRWGRRRGAATWFGGARPPSASQGAPAAAESMLLKSVDAVESIAATEDLRGDIMRK